jgi:hypothetical protein
MMRAKTLLLIPSVLGLVCVAGCARQAPAPAAQPDTTAANTSQASLPVPTTPVSAQSVSTNYTARGRIRQLNYAEDGRVNGFLLDSGTLIYLPDSFSGTIPPLRSRVEISGTLHPSAPGRTVVTAQLVEESAGKRLGSFVTTPSPTLPTGNAAVVPPLPVPPAGNVAAIPPPPVPPALIVDGAAPPPPPPLQPDGRARRGPLPPPPPPSLAAPPPQPNGAAPPPPPPAI